MTKVKVYQFELYDTASNQYLSNQDISLRRWGTLEAISTLRSARPIYSSEIEVDESDLKSDIDGMTEPGFSPPTEGELLREAKE
ncbi:hypothetical protein [Herbaspirillum sp. C7C8]|uniref:hypothetical protein n=1 Tax=Herbaspirillum sp. C7C8 TaxID=2736665 RepID=UPI001F522EF2|nr:hypothetical protein [Herbaspirillum sp. C7C8]MCI1005190.1 hypothetical protein [Herbaspirillum sp. C7C8]